jgi:hypothetical protein
VPLSFNKKSYLDSMAYLASGSVTYVSRISVLKPVYGIENNRVVYTVNPRDIPGLIDIGVNVKSIN